MKIWNNLYSNSEGTTEKRNTIGMNREKKIKEEEIMLHFVFDKFECAILPEILFSP